MQYLASINHLPHLFRDYKSEVEWELSRYGHLFFAKYTTRYSRSQGMDRIPGHQLFLLQEPQYLKEK